MENRNMLQEFSIELALTAGKILKDNFRTPLKTRHKDPTDIVTHIDELAEKSIIERIKKTYPGHGILAEETGQHNMKSDYQWIIDPLDGTANYAMEIPCFCTSIALAHKKEIILGTVYNPLSEELFTATKDSAPTLNGRPISVSGTMTLKDARVTFARSKREDMATKTALASKLLHAHTFRLYGATALDMANIATGRTDAHVAFCQMPWDYAASQLILKNAGGNTTDFKGNPLEMKPADILATNTKLHKELLGITKQ
ncbi:MAG: inositol monophosphatase family protein [archaeon]